MDLKQKYGKVAVVMGGDSQEREISLISGNRVLSSLLKSGVDAYSFDPKLQPIEELASLGFARAVLMTHGTRGEDGILQGAIEYQRIPYTGSGVMASAIGMDKYRTKLIWQTVGVPVAKSQYVLRSNFSNVNFKLELSLPVVVKPANDGSSVGVSWVTKIDDLAPAIDLVFKNSEALLIESMIVGDEFTITVCDGVVYPIVKIVTTTSNEKHDYKNKYFTDSIEYVCPFDFGKAQANIESLALKGYNAIGARGIARLDFMVTANNDIFFLEINTIPGMTGHSLVPMAFEAKNIGFDELCLFILDRARLGN